MKFRKKPVVIEAVKWNPDYKGNQIGGWPKTKAWKPAKKWYVSVITLSLFIPTLEGEMEGKPGDYVIKGVKDEFYPCKPDIFEATYESL